MEWESLLKPYRLGCPKDAYDGEKGRSEFHRDYDRIIFSTAFRRLFGKTQVVPFPDSDLTHTRLTHSLETASVGRSLGNIIKDKGSQSLRESPYDIGALVAASCLCHDIGNPPLGHSGECAIQNFFKDEGKKYLEKLTDQQKEDFYRFDGNAMGFHLLTHSNPLKTKSTGGLGITYPVLATYTKYPSASYDSNSETCNLSRKKPGLFSTDRDTYSEIAHELHITKHSASDSWLRHPLAFLAEAADDICNTIIDYEDGYKANIISYSEINKQFSEIANALDSTKPKDIDKIISEREKVGYLRSKAIGSLVAQVSNLFIEQEEDFLSGIVNTSIIKSIKSHEIIETIKKDSSKKLYNHYRVLMKEIAGNQILPGLLEIFLKASQQAEHSRSKKILQILPDDITKNLEKDPYLTLMDITQYVCGMTDNYAVDMYRKLTGVEIPDY